MPIGGIALVPLGFLVETSFCLPGLTVNFIF